MNGWTYGLIVEGEFDSEVFEEFVLKVCGSNARVVCRVAGGKAQLMAKFPKLLWSFQHVSLAGGPADKAVVIRDADGKDTALLERQMRELIGPRSPTFPGGISVHAVPQEMETWLLADVNAINKVATARGGRAIAPVTGSLETLLRPSQKFQELLSDARLNYTPQVCRLIARETNLETLKGQCPSFGGFRQKILDP